MAGKNTICPECRHRLKVPVPKHHRPDDWRTAGQHGPSLAKPNFEKPKDVQDAGDVKIVGREALKHAGATNEEFEPRPLKQKVLLGLTAVGLLAGIGFGVMYLMQSRKEGRDDRLIETALKEYAEASEKPQGAQAPLYSAVLEMAAADYYLRKPEPQLKEAHAHLTKARSELLQAAQKDDPRKPSAAGERNAVLGELALCTVGFGGVDEQVRDEKRLKWMPDLPGGRQLRVNEKVQSVHAELQRTLDLLKPADFDFKAVVARRLTRALTRHGQQELAAGIPVMLFAEPEQPEAKAIVALEIYRLDKGSDTVRQIADELKGLLAGGPGGRSPLPTSAQTLWQVLGTEKAPSIVLGSLPPTGDVLEGTRLAYTGLYLLQDRADEALKLCERPGPLPGQLKGLALYAEWAPDPGPAFAKAREVVVLAAGKKETVSQSAILRLSQLAAAAGRAEEAKALADTLTDDGLKSWAKADAVRLQLAPQGSGSRADDAAVELPDDPRKLRVGHAWGRLAVARHNARLTGSRDTGPLSGWPAGTIHPFGLAGVALGVQDREAGQ
jgi:hypothetical protein